MCQNLSNHNTTECLPRAPKVLRTLDSFCLNFLKLLETCKPRTDCNKLPSRTPRTFAEATVTLPRPSPRRSTRMNHTWPLHISSLARTGEGYFASKPRCGRHGASLDATLFSRTLRCFPERHALFQTQRDPATRPGARAADSKHSAVRGTGAAGTGLAPSTPSLFPTDTI